jgi:hypothetical protein
MLSVISGGPQTYHTDVARWLSGPRAMDNRDVSEMRSMQTKDPELVPRERTNSLSWDTGEPSQLPVKKSSRASKLDPSVWLRNKSRSSGRNRTSALLGLLDGSFVEYRKRSGRDGTASRRCEAIAMRGLGQGQSQSHLPKVLKEWRALDANPTRDEDDRFYELSIHVRRRPYEATAHTNREFLADYALLWLP